MKKNSNKIKWKKEVYAYNILYNSLCEYEYNVARKYIQIYRNRLAHQSSDQNLWYCLDDDTVCFG